MKPKDENGNLPPEKRPFRVLIIAGSDRRQYNCPGVDSKARTLMLRMAERLPQEWEIDYEDLGNVFGRARIQSCNACVSTSMALCVWPCNCYERKSKAEPDLMWDLDIYSRLDLADAWAIIGPVNWYAPSSNLKLMFDRLVCMHGGNPREDLINHKDPELAMKLEHSAQWQQLSLNHLEGRTAGFFCYTDDGANEVGSDGRPRLLRHKSYFDPEALRTGRSRRRRRAALLSTKTSTERVGQDTWHHTCCKPERKCRHCRSRKRVGVRLRSATGASGKCSWSIAASTVRSVAHI